MSNFTKSLAGRLALTAVLGLGVLVLGSPAAYCASPALNSGTSTVALTATLPETLTVSATPNAVSFTLVPNGTATGSSAVAITTTWSLASSRTSGLTLTAWFSSATQALAGQGANPDYIPSSAVLGEDPQGIPTTYTAFTQSPTADGLGVANASLILYQVPTSGTGGLNNTNRGGTHVDNLSLEINLAGQTVQADTYTGTLNIAAQAL